MKLLLFLPIGGSRLEASAATCVEYMGGTKEMHRTHCVSLLKSQSPRKFAFFPPMLEGSMLVCCAFTGSYL